MVAGRAAGVVVLRVPEARGPGGVGVVELAQAHEGAGGVGLSDQAVRLPLADRLAAAPDEAQLVEAAEAGVDGIGAGAQVHGGIHGDGRIGLGGGLGQAAPQIQQQGVGREGVAHGQLPQAGMPLPGGGEGRAQVVPGAAVVGPPGQAAALAAASVVHGPDVVAQRPGQGDRAPHVVRLVAAPEAVEDQHQHFRLPGVVASGQLVPVGQGEAEGLRWVVREGAGQVVAQDRLQVSADGPPRGTTG